jgi:hypothetical protein
MGRIDHDIVVRGDNSMILRFRTIVRKDSAGLGIRLEGSPCPDCCERDRNVTNQDPHPGADRINLGGDNRPNISRSATYGSLLDRSGMGVEQKTSSREPSRYFPAIEGSHFVRFHFRGATASPTATTQHLSMRLSSRVSRLITSRLYPAVFGTVRSSGGSSGACG